MKYKTLAVEEDDRGGRFRKPCLMQLKNTTGYLRFATSPIAQNTPTQPFSSLLKTSLATTVN